MIKRILLPLLLLVPAVAHTTPYVATIDATTKGNRLETTFTVNEEGEGVYEDSLWKVVVTRDEDDTIVVDIYQRADENSAWELINSSRVQAPGTLEFVDSENDDQLSITINEA